MTHPDRSSSVSVPKTRTLRRLRSREWPRPPRRDPHTRLIAQLLDLAGPDSSVIATSSRPWASATFTGARHVIILRLKGADHARRADEMAAAVPDAEFSITGHIVADACVDKKICQPDATAESASRSDGTVMHLSVLTIEDW